MKDAVGALRVEVEDNGVGFNEVDQASFFNEFSDFDRIKVQGGGPAISLCKMNIIHIHLFSAFFYQVVPDWVFGSRRQSSPCMM